jgi:hypothetical protein
VAVNVRRKMTQETDSQTEPKPEVGQITENKPEEKKRSRGEKVALGFGILVLALFIILVITRGQCA